MQMPFKMESRLVFMVTAFAALISYSEIRQGADAVWLDSDMQSIPEPRARESGLYDDLFKNQAVEQWKKNFDVPRLARSVTGHRKPAANVNALDEVPDSSWYTNRHLFRRMTVDELVRGPNHGPGPDFARATITKAKTSGVTPGMQLKDRDGTSYLIKFDDIKYPELQSGAEVISTKILYAAGYNVPENYLAFINSDNLQIGEGAQIADPTGKKRAFTVEDLNEILSRVARMPDGRYRVMASKILSGKPKGPFSQIGIRRDDPNDRIPHEHRRELRGLRVIASWINHWDMKEDNGLDMYVEENGRKFLRHYLIDFGSTLGGGKLPMEYFHGREYAVDFNNMVKEIFTLGIFKAPDEKEGVLISPEVGMFSAADFDPEHWRTSFPVMPFLNMTREDAFWATRIMLSFTEPELRSIVETAQYTDPKDTDYVLRVLLERRRIVAEHWLRQINPIAYFSVDTRSEGVVINFHDLMVDWKFSDPANTTYAYEIRGPHYKSEKKATRDAMILVDRRTLGEALEKERAGEPVEITIWARRTNSKSDPVKIYLYKKADDSFGIGRISRG